MGALAQGVPRRGCLEAPSRAEALGGYGKTLTVLFTDELPEEEEDEDD